LVRSGRPHFGSQSSGAVRVRWTRHDHVALSVRMLPNEVVLVVLVAVACVVIVPAAP
jgi:hypothetical protein